MAAVKTQELPRKLGLVDSAAIVIGTMIGSAIFIVPSSVARNVRSPGMILAIWLVAGLISYFGALAYAELGAMMPATGGQYVFLRESFGSLWAFLCGWSFFLAARSGGVATVAAGFPIYLSYFFPLSPALSRLIAAALIAVLTAVNYRGIAMGAAVQKCLTFLKVLGLAVLIGAAFLSAPHAAPSRSSPDLSWNQFGVAMIACLWAYNGWVAISFVAGEVREPERNFSRSLVIGVAAVIVLYLLANLAYLRVLPIEEIAASERVGAAVAERAMGPVGAALLSLTILLSIAGTTNGNMMTAPRLYFAQARDGLFFSRFGEVHPRFQVPSFAILGQGIWAAILALSGSYEKLFAYSVFAFWIFYGMTAAAVLVLRRKYPDHPRPYKMWGYPVTPLLFTAISFWFVVNTLFTRPETSLPGLILMASGVPMYYIWRKRRKQGEKSFRPHH